MQKRIWPWYIIHKTKTYGANLRMVVENFFPHIFFFSRAIKL